MLTPFGTSLGKSSHPRAAIATLMKLITSCHMPKCDGQILRRCCDTSCPACTISHAARCTLCTQSAAEAWYALDARLSGDKGSRPLVSSEMLAAAPEVLAAGVLGS